MTKKQQIKIFEEKKVRTVWDDEEEKWYFSIADVVEVLTDSTDVKQYIKKMRSRDPELNARWGTICTPTRMLASDGKYYKTQAATMEGIFRIIQSIPSSKAEPFKQWMAEVAAQRIDQMQDPELNYEQGYADYRRLGYSDKWINQRLKSIEVRTGRCRARAVYGAGRTGGRVLNQRSLPQIPGAAGGSQESGAAGKGLPFAVRVRQSR